LNKISWDFEVRQTGRSTDLVDGYHDYFMDYIIQSGKSYSTCYRMPKLKSYADLSNLEVGVSDIYRQFEGN
jgi:hypothetical protein